MDCLMIVLSATDSECIEELKESSSGCTEMCSLSKSIICMATCCSAYIVIDNTVYVVSNLNLYAVLPRRVATYSRMLLQILNSFLQMQGPGGRGSQV